jgi:hypothetical protein
VLEKMSPWEQHPKLDIWWTPGSKGRTVVRPAAKKSAISDGVKMTQITIITEFVR